MPTSRTGNTTSNELCHPVHRLFEICVGALSYKQRQLGHSHYERIRNSAMLSIAQGTLSVLVEIGIGDRVG